MAVLKGISSDVEGQVIELTENETTIGRHDNNKVVIGHLSISSFHCVIMKMGDKYTIKDLDSTNGSRVEGQKIKVKALADGNKVHIGGLAFRFVSDDDSPAAAADSSSDAAPTPAVKARRTVGATGKIRTGTVPGSTGTFKKASRFRGKSLLIIVGIAVIAGLIGLVVLFAMLSKMK